MLDRMTDKTTRWAFTAYEAQWSLFVAIPDIVAEWGYQKEVCPETGRQHYQGYIRTKRQVRFSQLIKVFPGVHLEIARNWPALVHYCNKTDTAVPDSQVHQVNGSPAMTMAQAMDRLAAQGDLPPEAPPDERTVRERRLFRREQIVEDYWRRVNILLTEDENLLGLYTQPQYLRAWENTCNFWIDRQTDRQTEEDERTEE